MGELEDSTKVSSSNLLGELRTIDYGILKLRDTISIDMAIKLLQSLKDRALKYED